MLDAEGRPQIAYANALDGHVGYHAGRGDDGTWRSTELPIDAARVGLARVDDDVVAVVQREGYRELQSLLRIEHGWEIGPPTEPQQFWPGGQVADAEGRLHVAAVDAGGLNDVVLEDGTWTSARIGSGHDAQAAAAPDGQVSFAYVKSNALHWQPLGGAPERVFASDARPLQARGENSMMLAVAGPSDAGEEAQPSILFLGARPPANDADDEAPAVAVMLATRRDGAWQVDDVEVEGGAAAFLHPLALVASAAGEVRGFYLRVDADRDVRTLVVCWPTAEGVATADLVALDGARLADAQVGADGAIHLVIDAEVEVRYLRLDP